MKTVKEELKEYHELIDYSAPGMQERLRLPEGKLSELIDGILYVWPSSPMPHHQYIVAELLVDLRSHVITKEFGDVYHAPIDLYLCEGTVAVVPDIVYISKDNPLIVDECGLCGVPDMIIEVMSRESKKRDLTIKKFLYAGAGVREYWIVDPITKNAQGYLLEDGNYGDPLLMNSEIYVRGLKKLVRFSFD